MKLMYLSNIKTGRFGRPVLYLLLINRLIMLIIKRLKVILSFSIEGVIYIYFTSKKDFIYFLAVWGTIVLIFLSITLDFSVTVFHFLWGVIGLLTIGFLIWIWFGTGYRIENKTINIQNGPFKWKVTIEEINSISKRKSLLATPALSVDRLVLQHGKYNDMLLSPKNECEFIKLLLAKNPHIQLEKDIKNLME